MVSYYNKPDIDTRRIERFHAIKKEHMPFLSATLWGLTSQRGLFNRAMQHALFGMWQKMDTLSKKRESHLALYEIALEANQHAWEHRDEPQETAPAETHHLSRLFSGRTHLAHRVRQTISQLDPFHALLIVLRYMERKQASVIAAFLKCDEAQVEFSITQAVVELKSKLRIHIKSTLQLHGLANSELADLELIAV
jgi:DNA-directed RNA polymerase specialized sigma24 family protein